MLASLPIDSHIPHIVALLERSRAVVIVAEPGAGKTTRVPPALVDTGTVILLQPRRVAARAIAQRIAEEQAWTIGREVGWQIRFERRFSAETKLLVATEGVLTAKLQDDPLLSGVRTVVLDEFHERSIHADVALTLTKQAWLARSDLRIVVMSATIDAAAVSAFLGNCPVVEVPGRLHPLAMTYAPGSTVAEAARELLNQTSGDLLCFLPGALEIQRTIADLQRRDSPSSLDVLPLHGSLDMAEQSAVLRPSPTRRRIIVSTNIAETSITVPGVTAVVDSGLHKVARYDAARGIDSLETERIPQDAADQRAGRAGRLGPGVVRRVWDARDRLRPHREAEIHRVDLSSTVLDIMAWGGDARTLGWFERPEEDAIQAALRLVERLGAVRDGKLTDLGRQIQRLPLHPRLARMILAGGGHRSLCQAAAILSERNFVKPRTATTSSDLLSAIDGWHDMPAHVHRAAREIERLVSASVSVTPPSLNEERFRQAVLSGYPDRVAQRRDRHSDRVKLSSGTGAVIAAESGVRDGDYLVALDVRSVNPPANVNTSVNRSIEESRIRLASRIEIEWLVPNATTVEHRFDRDTGVVRAVALDKFDAIVLAERPAAPDPDITASLLADAWLSRGPGPADIQLLRRLRFTGHSVDVADIIRSAAHGVRALNDVDLRRALTADVRRTLDRDAPETLVVPSGRAMPLDYGEDGSVTASVKLQELFGLAETPRLGPKREPVRFELLAPNGRPVQTTRDLRSFWDKTYPEVRKELRGRYPKHPWPDDPWSATPTARTTRRRT